MWPHRAHCICLSFCSICLPPPSFDLFIWIDPTGANNANFGNGTIRCFAQEIFLRFRRNLLSLFWVEPSSLSCQHPCSAKSFEGSTWQSQIQGFPLPSTTTFIGREPLGLFFNEISLRFFLFCPDLLICRFTFGLILPRSKPKTAAESFPEKFFSGIRGS